MASNHRRDSARPIKLGRYATLEPDGTLRLPPIVRPKAEDPFANSKLLTYRLARQKDAQLTKIVSVLRCYYYTVWSDFIDLLEQIFKSNQINWIVVLAVKPLAMPLR